MANGIRTGNTLGFNKGRSSKFRESSRVRQTPEEGRRTYLPKRCGNNNKDEDNFPKTFNDKNCNSLCRNKIINVRAEWLTVWKKIYSDLFKVLPKNIHLQITHTHTHTHTHIYIYIYIYKEDLALNVLQVLIGIKYQPTNQQTCVHIFKYIYM